MEAALELLRVVELLKMAGPYLLTSDLCKSSEPWLRPLRNGSAGQVNTSDSEAALVWLVWLMVSRFLKVNLDPTWRLSHTSFGLHWFSPRGDFVGFILIKYELVNCNVFSPPCFLTSSTQCSSIFVSSLEPARSCAPLMVSLSLQRRCGSLAWRWWIFSSLSRRAEGRNALRGTVCRVPLRVVQLTPASTLTPNPSRDLSWEGSCSTQNGARFRKTARDAHKWREGARELHTEESFILSQIFLPLLCVLFCFLCTETIGLSSDTSLSPPCRHLVSLEWRCATIGGRRHHGRYGSTAAGTSRIPGGKTLDEGLMRVRPRHPGRNACKWYAHSKRSLGGRRPSSCWAQRKMSGSGQKNDNQASPPPFSFSVFFNSKNANWWTCNSLVTTLEQEVCYNPDCCC